MTQIRPPAGVCHRRVALICDLAEEQWPSMDLVADMIFHHLQAEHSEYFSAVQVRPPMLRRFSRLPFVGGSAAARNGDRLMNRMRDYPNWLRQRAKGFDLFHVIDHSYSQVALELNPQRTVVTCHDLDTFRCLIEPGKDPRPRWFQQMVRRILKGMAGCARVICVSHAVREEILRHNLLPAERLVVVHNGAHPSCSPRPDPEADARAAALLGRSAGQAQPYLLHVGSTIPRKRIDVLLRVLAGVRKRMPAVELVRVGGPFTPQQTDLVGALELGNSIRVLPFVDREVLAAIYRNAAAVLLPSDAEGFGLPLMEALACGCLAVVSDLPVFREISGSAVEFCPAGDPDAWIPVVLRLLEETRFRPGDLTVRRDLALRQAERFTWSAATRKLAEIYRQVLESNKEGYRNA